MSWARAMMLAAGFALSGCASDRIDFTNQASTGENAPPSAVGLAVARTDDVIAGSVEAAGVLVDGRMGNPGELSENDAGFVSPDAHLSIINRVAGDLNEIIAFSRYRRPEVVAMRWTNNPDVAKVHFKPRITIPVTIWIVHGPFAAQRDHALEAIGRTMMIWNAERTGLAIGAVTINDATTDPDAPSVTAFPNGDQGDAIGWMPLRNLIGFQAGRVNIYWVDTVDGSTSTGWSNFGAQIAMGRNTGDELLSHELGHAFSLEHIDADTAHFNDRNVMHSASDVRTFMTEGQIFRVHLNPGSALRNVYTPPAPALPPRACAHAQADNACPAVTRRIWRDGAFPADNL